ncbi:unnamed protein product [Spirodela intermedia]|uniref:Uncharacterized protein n=1 Tax=Spirodela intermedia TaxID=51605 RepID=A0A7I8JA68_SPIIN|nr:unnamed protein product [Spirodela intermedia]CAA6666332.1 unnamed protein product [Spirodela intermedia]
MSFYLIQERRGEELQTESAAGLPPGGAGHGSAAPFPPPRIPFSPPTGATRRTLGIRRLSPPPVAERVTQFTLTHVCELLERCSSMTELKQIQAQMIRAGLAFDPPAADRLVSVCALQGFGSLLHARLMLSMVPNPTSFACNSIVRAYTNNNLPQEALLFYAEMIDSVLQGSWEGEQLHCHVVKLGFGYDSYVQNTLINMYSDCGSLSSAIRAFDRMVGRNTVSWATMIGAYTKWNRPVEALELYRRMDLEPNRVTLLNVLSACSRARDLESGRRVHKHISAKNLKVDLVLATALLDMYCKCGCLPLARQLFDAMPNRNQYSWNVIINGHIEHSSYEEALLLFREMQLSGIPADEVTLASLLLACSHLGALELGKWLHACIRREKVQIDVVLGTALVDMYAKCGCAEIALQVFRELPCRDVMTWTAVIGGLAMCGRGEEALELFAEMQSQGIRPDAPRGLLDEASSYFRSMSSVYSIQPSVEHYGCMVDLYGRAGRVDRAEELVNTMPMEPDYFVLGSLLGSCRIHGNVKMAERTVRRILKIYPDDARAYWEELERTRELMTERSIRKPPGCTMVEVNGVVHEFSMGDGSHPHTA